MSPAAFIFGGFCPTRRRHLHVRRQRDDQHNPWIGEGPSDMDDSELGDDDLMPTRSYGSAERSRTPPMRPWDEHPRKLYIPEDLLYDPIFMYEVQGLMVQFFRGRLDEKYAKNIQDNRVNKPDAPTAEDLQQREEYKQAAIRAIKENPQDWLLRNWQTQTPIEIDALPDGPIVFKDASRKSTLQKLSVTPPLIDPAVLEELDELAVKEVSIEEHAAVERSSRVPRFIRCKNCGREVDSREVAELGVCQFCSDKLSERCRKDMYESMLIEGSENKSPIARPWPQFPACKQAEKGVFLSRYLNDPDVRSLSRWDEVGRGGWLVGGDPTVYDDYPLEAVLEEGSASAEDDVDDPDAGDEDADLGYDSQDGFLSEFNYDDPLDDELDDDPEFEDQLGDDDLLPNRAQSGAERPHRDCVGCANFESAVNCLQHNVATIGSTPGGNYLKMDVALADGARGAMRAALEVLCRPGDTVIIMQPSCGLAASIAQDLGIKIRYYKMLTRRRPDIHVDPEEMRRVVDDGARAIVLSNPLPIGGTILQERELMGILEVAAEAQLPIIADEVLSDFVFRKEWMSGVKPLGLTVPEPRFVHMADVVNGAGSSVPVLTVGEISHRFHTPLFRLGWLLIAAADDELSRDVREALRDVGRAQLPLDLHHSAHILAKFLDPEKMNSAEVVVQNTCRSLVQLIRFVHNTACFRCEMPVAGNSLLAKVDLDVLGFPDEGRLTTYLLSKSIGIVPGSVFGAPGYCYLQPREGHTQNSLCAALRENLAEMESRRRRRA